MPQRAKAVVIRAGEHRKVLGKLRRMSTEFEWTDEDDAAVVYESLPDWHPSLFVDAFRVALTSDEPYSVELMRRGFVTPECVDDWGDFSEARAAWTSALKVSMTPLWAVDAPDVAYVRLVETDAWIANTKDQPATHHVTLVWRPDIAVLPRTSWRIHAIGDPVPPDLLPRTAPGFDPRTLPNDRT